MPGKRYNYRITEGALKGLRARLVRLEPNDRATVEVPGQEGQYGIPQKWMKRLDQKSTKPRKRRRPDVRKRGRHAGR